MASLGEALGGARSFDPAAAEGVLRLSALDAEQTALVPQLLVQLRATAPGLQLSVISLKRHDMPEALAAGQIGIAIGVFPGIGAPLVSEPLYEQGYAVVGLQVVIGVEGR